MSNYADNWTISDSDNAAGGAGAVLRDEAEVVAEESAVLYQLALDDQYTFDLAFIWAMDESNASDKAGEALCDLREIALGNERRSPDLVIKSLLSAYADEEAQNRYDDDELEHASRFEVAA